MKLQKQPDTPIARKINISTPCIGDEEWNATRESFHSGWLTQGPKVSAFENAFAKRHNVNHALAVTSCTTGLHLALAALGIKEGDEVIVPAFTWVATANVVLYCGATPVFVDVTPETFNIDIEKIFEKITDKTKAIIPVHLFGRCVDFDRLQQVVPDHIAIIEDAACAAGASWRDHSAGSLGDVGVFSFHPRKSITTGEGGMITTNNKDLGQLMDCLRNHGASISEEQRHNGPEPYLLPDFNLLGYNYRMTDLQGAVGLTQLGKLDQFIFERRKAADYYRRELSDISWLKLPKEDENSIHAYQAFVTIVDPKTAPKPRNEIMKILQESGIATRPGTHAVHMLNYYADKYGIKADDYPMAKFCNDHSMAIPLHNQMSDEDYAYIVKIIKSIN